MLVLRAAFRVEFESCVRQLCLLVFILFKVCMYVRLSMAQLNGQGTVPKPPGN